MRGFLFSLLLLCAVAMSMPEEEIKKDMDYIRKVERRLKEIDSKIQRGELNRELLGELNSYGYPIHQLKDKYLREEGKKEREVYRKAESLYNEVLFVKRGAFPRILKEEMEALKVPVCKVSAEGSRRETLVIGIENPEDEDAVLKIMTQTQLRSAHLIGIKNVNFERCK
jgi:hypothetical protein